MCTTRPVTEDSLAEVATAVGHPCPLCETSTRIEYMRFLDPHGVWRVDGEVFECAARRHTFAATQKGIRLLASDSKRPPAQVLFVLNEGQFRQT